MFEQYLGASVFTNASQHIYSLGLGLFTIVTHTLIPKKRTSDESVSLSLLLAATLGHTVGYGMGVVVLMGNTATSQSEAMLENGRMILTNINKTSLCLPVWCAPVFRSNN